MEAWNTILNTALLGIEKRGLKKEDLPGVLHPVFEQPASAEEVFLGSAAAVYNLRQCGFVAVRKEGLDLPQAEAEQKPYASDASHIALKEIVESGSASLLRFWLEQCTAAGVVVRPDAVPLLLEAGAKTKSLRSLCADCCGNRGKWLSALNPDWTPLTTQPDEELWQTGTPAQRNEILQRMRGVDATAGRAALQQTWPQESAATKADLLEALRPTLSGDDAEWLETLLAEKSAKVKGAALQLLKAIPSSAVVKSYWDVLSASVQLNTTRGILGIGAKQTVEVALVPVDPAVFKTGIAQSSGGSAATDEAFVLHQLIAAVPPALWERHFGMERSEVVQLLSKEHKTKSWLPVMGVAAARFNDLNWLRAVIKTEGAGLINEAFYLLPQAEAEAYALRFVSDEATVAYLLNSIEKFPEEWSPPFAEALLRFTANNPYHYHRGWYNNVAQSLPAAVVGKLESFAPKEGYLSSMWENVSQHIAHLIVLKQQTKNAFKE